ncbi:MAG: hypothetical protein A3F54_00470 [Candidatus Kerfeldbacteria bacterium RIFCSPHIGHO2_12_FULL_48_17]|uniref:Uncharacterized protein n=1 Tax=Candidatus Kerfeldbacteria bacterium RIFCSPHIGHO2_12_FULL_48_17 TaxID=1798542 RepID=A0A1G2B6M1_9BACT|nr:MAG: hypothetical protein A3F54_00470 [Candidatus Kerfeldbacteria bacterium RIFCSPHIGHO2_12_FULL_48_17]
MSSTFHLPSKQEATTMELANLQKKKLLHRLLLIKILSPFGDEAINDAATVDLLEAYWEVGITRYTLATFILFADQIFEVEDINIIVEGFLCFTARPLQQKSAPTWQFFCQNTPLPIPKPEEDTFSCSAYGF